MMAITAGREAHIDTWSYPVIEALDEIEDWDGFTPDEIQWEHFRASWHHGAGDLEVFIFAYRGDAGSYSVIFRADGQKLTAQTPEHAAATAEEAAAAISVSLEAMQHCLQRLGNALKESRDRYITEFMTTTVDRSF